MNAVASLQEAEPGLSHQDFLALQGLGRIPEFPITRAAVIPLEYTAACRAIASCLTIKEGKYWANKSDALAAWSKIYQNDEAGCESRKLKLHAFRRMSQIAEELRPQLYLNKGGHLRKQDGPVSVLRAEGFTASQCGTIRAIGKLSEQQFAETLEDARGPTGVRHLVCKGTDAWKKLVLSSNGLSQWKSFANRNGARALAKGLTGAEKAKARLITAEIRSWLDAFESSL